MKFWEYKDKSDLTVPNRDIEWYLGLPYIVKLSVALGWESGFYTLRILVFNFHFAHGAFCGKECRFNVAKWLLGFVISNGWLFSADIGISYTHYLQWEIVRAVKRMTPKKRAELIKEMAEIEK